MTAPNELMKCDPFDGCPRHFPLGNLKWATALHDEDGKRSETVCIYTALVAVAIRIAYFEF